MLPGQITRSVEVRGFMPLIPESLGRWGPAPSFQKSAAMIGSPDEMAHPLPYIGTIAMTSARNSEHGQWLAPDGVCTVMSKALVCRAGWRSYDRFVAAGTMAGRPLGAVLRTSGGIEGDRGKSR